MKRSPRAPIFPLQEALGRAIEVYQYEGLNDVPIEAAVEAMGYRGLSGASRQALATLKTYGLLENRGTGMVAVSRDVQAYKLAPEKEQQQQYLKKFLRAPAAFNAILEKYSNGLPSDGSLMHFLVVELAYREPAAKKVIKCFRSSIEFIGVDSGDVVLNAEPGKLELKGAEANFDSGSGEASAGPARVSGVGRILTTGGPVTLSNDYDDPIPVRLRGGRKAWLTVPKPFYESDKSALRSQIDLLITDDEEED